MSEIKNKPPPVTSNKKYWSVDRLGQTLGYYYNKKRREFAEDLPGFFSPDLKRIFKEIEGQGKIERADTFIKRYRRNIVNSIGMWIGKNNYLINELMSDLIKTAGEMKLYRYTEENTALLQLTAYVNTLAMNYLEPVGKFDLSSRGGRRSTWRSSEIN